MALYYFGWWRMNALGIFAIVPPGRDLARRVGGASRGATGLQRRADRCGNGRRNSPADAPASRQRDGCPAPRRRPPDLALRRGPVRAQGGRKRWGAGGDRRRARDRIWMGPLPRDRTGRAPLRRPGFRAAPDRDAAGNRSAGRHADEGGENDGVRGTGPRARRRRTSGGGGLRGNRRGDGGAHGGTLLDPDASRWPDECRHAAGARA